MRTILAACLALATLTSLAGAKPRRHRSTPRDSSWVRTCIDERTGPTGGISAPEARKICLAEQPDDEVAAAKQQLALARANAKVAKAKARARKAIDACEQAIVDACVEAALPDGSTDCMDSDLWSQFESICSERGPRPAGGN